MQKLLPLVVLRGMLLCLTLNQRPTVLYALNYIGIDASGLSSAYRNSAFNTGSLFFCLLHNDISCLLDGVNNSCQLEKGLPEISLKWI